MFHVIEFPMTTQFIAALKALNEIPPVVFYA